MGAEAREHPRARARVRVEYHFGSRTGIGHTNDLSEGGMFLECDQIARPNTRVYLRLHLPGSRAGDPLKIIGIVTRSVDSAHIAGEGGAARTGMGIHFEVAYSRTREQLTEFMGNLLIHGDAPGDPPPKPDVRLVPGSTDENMTYAARFPELQSEDYKRLETLRPPDVDRAFAFDANEPPPIQWGRLSGAIVKWGLVLAVVCIIVYLFAMYAGAFQGTR